MRIDTVGHLKYIDECGDEGALVGLPAAGDCAHMGITAAVRVYLWFAAIDLLAAHPPHAVRAMLLFKMCMKVSLITNKVCIYT
jgi:hypothetical protein